MEEGEEVISCRECIENLKPDDPRVRSGRYGLCGCDYCNKPTYYIELEEKRKEPTLRIPPEHKLYRELQQLKGLTLHLQRKLNEHLDKKKKDVI